MEAETPQESRPMSGTEYSWYKAVPTGTGITVLALHLARPIPIPALSSALHKLLNSHPVLSSAAGPTSLRLIPTTSPPQITTNPLPQPPPPSPSSPSPSPSPLHTVLELELNINPWAPPLPSRHVSNFFAAVYEDPDRPLQVVALRFHTAVCDRTSAVAILKELLGLIGEGRDTEVIAEKGEVRMGIEDLIREEDSWKPFWAKGRDLVGYSVNGLRSSGLKFEEVGTDRSSEVVRLVMDRAQTQRLLTACKGKGMKLCGALAAAGLIAIYSSKHLEKNQSETYSIVTLVDCRKFLDPALDDHDIGFYHSGILNTHKVHWGEGLWEVAMRYHSAYSNAKNNKKHLTDIGDLNFLMCKAIENPQLTPSSSLRTAAITVFEEPVIYETSILQEELGVEDYIGCSSIHGVGPSIAIFDTIRDGQLDCSLVYPSPLHSRKQIKELVEHMERILTEGSCNVVEVTD